MSQLSHDPRARIIANGTTWTKATSATKMANASTAELTGMTGYSSKAEAGLQPTCSEFNTILHRGCLSGQFLFCTKKKTAEQVSLSRQSAFINVTYQLIPSGDDYLHMIVLLSLKSSLFPFQLCFYPWSCNNLPYSGWNRHTRPASDTVCPRDRQSRRGMRKRYCCQKTHARLSYPV